jgi:hypothetical protein
MDCRARSVKHFRWNLRHVVRYPSVLRSLGKDFILSPSADHMVAVGPDISAPELLFAAFRTDVLNCSLHFFLECKKEKEKAKCMLSICKIKDLTDGVGRQAALYL